MNNEEVFMNTTTEALNVARGISDYGIMIVICAVFLVLSSGVMIACFQWFKAIINGMIEDGRKDADRQEEKWNGLMEMTRLQNEKLDGLSEGLRTETQLRIGNLSALAFDLSIEKVCILIKRMRRENHIADTEATREKILRSLTVMHEDRKSRFDAFTYRGKRLSEYCSEEWIEKVAKVVEGELYDEKGENDGRAYTNVKLAYDDIRTDFYHKLNN